MKDHGRFIVTDIEGTYGRTVILADWLFWTDHEAELAAWCRAHGAHWQGMTVDMSEEVLTLFTLRWS